MPSALLDGHKALWHLRPRLDKPPKGLLAPRLSLLGLHQHPPHPLLAFALEASEFGCQGEAGCGYLFFAGLAGSLAILTISISAGLSASATARDSTVGGTLGVLSQTQNPKRCRPESAHRRQAVAHPAQVARRPVQLDRGLAGGGDRRLQALVGGLDLFDRRRPQRPQPCSQRTPRLASPVGL